MEFKLGPNTTLDLSADRWQRQFEYEQTVLSAETAMSEAYQCFIQHDNAQALHQLYCAAAALARQHCLLLYTHQVNNAMAVLSMVVDSMIERQVDHLCKRLAVAALVAHRIGIAAHFGSSHDLNAYVKAHRNFDVVTITEWTTKNVVELADWCAEIGGAHAH